MTPAMEPPGPASRNAGACPDIFIVCERTRRGQRAGGRRCRPVARQTSRCGCALRLAASDVIGITVAAYPSGNRIVR